MPIINYTMPTSFIDSVEAAIIILQHAMNQLHDHMMFDEEPDPAVLHAAHHLSSTLEDRRKEMEQLIDQVERKV